MFYIRSWKNWSWDSDLSHHQTKETTLGRDKAYIQSWTVNKEMQEDSLW